MFHTLAGIQSNGPGYKEFIIRPQPPAAASNAMHKPIDWVRASYESIRGTIRSDWKIDGDKFHLNATVPANTTATVFLPTSDASSITESGKSLSNHPHVKLLRSENGNAVLAVESGSYEFAALSGLPVAAIALQTSKPKDMSINPDGIDLSGATKLARWDFANPADAAKWTDRKSVDVVQRDGKAFLIATGDDSQMATTLKSAIDGQLVIELRAMPEKGATSQFFWANPGRGFNGLMQSKRTLTATDQVNAYLFTVSANGPVKKFRFDPFATFDKYANKGEMVIESITIYRLAE
jgi:alpha-L-rhamnosidase